VLLRHSLAGLRAKKVEILNSLRARDRDLHVHVRASSCQYHGNSMGLLAALCFVQLMTNCSYCKVSPRMLMLACHAPSRLIIPLAPLPLVRSVHLTKMVRIYEPNIPSHIRVVTSVSFCACSPA
jgi:hypothetical protein